ncbi:CBL-interacting serine/threonine-protein kinase 21 isoform X1 [Coffea eugenioides]|uniref:CBL-interacting serine/threonine-protein kinase 21 isoform X1 n=1 Tax=Coffea eugenioides TaxID=49369 RepID=UPI000F613EFD|nr:CBL-interacting serine/threonine-protein kinase 21 isoform X1 [Coffea eugenioides]
MGFSDKIGKYQLSRTIGEGSFAKVKLAINTTNGQYVAIKIIDKQMVLKNNLMQQVSREIRTMKLLHHPNIVRIYEVLGTKTKIYIVMEYVSGGQLSDKLSYLKKLSEREARKYFQQLIDAVDHCHCRGVYHRDLKPENLLLDNKGNVKVSDFGLSALKQKPGSLLSTACGSPSYVAPELLTDNGYDGAAADVWSCGVILFELRAGYLPFDDSNLTNLYRKIYKAEFAFPERFTEGEKQLISRLLDPNSKTRITIAEIVDHHWFQMDYEPAEEIGQEEDINVDDVHEAFTSLKETETEVSVPRASSFINAFQLIAMSNDLDLSRLFEEKGNEKEKKTIGSRHTVNETIEKIEAAAKDVHLAVEMMNHSKMKMHPRKMTRCSRSCLDLSAQVIEVAPQHCVVQVSKSTGELGLYKEVFCKSLSSLLAEELDMPSEVTQYQVPAQDPLNTITEDPVSTTNSNGKQNFNHQHG